MNRQSHFYFWLSLSLVLAIAATGFLTANLYLTGKVSEAASLAVDASLLLVLMAVAGLIAVLWLYLQLIYECVKPVLGSEPTKPGEIE